MSKHLNLSHARHPAQKNKMAELIKKGLCPFCRPQLEKYHDTPIIKKGRYWTTTFNDYPYQGTKKHYLIIANKHWKKISDISNSACQEFFSLTSAITKKEKISGGAIVIRFGNTNTTGATVTHLHAHFIIGAAKSKPAAKNKPLMVMVGYKNPVK